MWYIFLILWSFILLWCRHFCVTFDSVVHFLVSAVTAQSLRLVIHSHNTVSEGTFFGLHLLILFYLVSHLTWVLSCVIFDLCFILCYIWLVHYLVSAVTAQSPPFSSRPDLRQNPLLHSTLVRDSPSSFFTFSSTSLPLLALLKISQ